MDERRGESLHDLVGELLSLLDDGAHRVEVASEIENLERLHDEIETAVAEAQATQQRAERAGNLDP
jgi:hypothetical protein